MWFIQYLTVNGIFVMHTPTFLTDGKGSIGLFNNLKGVAFSTVIFHYLE